MDFSPGAIAFARRHNPELRFEVRNALAGYSDIGVFDGVLAASCIMHFDVRELDAFSAMPKR